MVADGNTIIQRRQAPPDARSSQCVVSPETTDMKMRPEIFSASGPTLPQVQDPVILHCLKSKQAVLDGEMILWNKAKCAFKPFGSLRAVLTAMQKGLTGEDRLETATYGFGWVWGRCGESVGRVKRAARYLARLATLARIQ